MTLKKWPLVDNLDMTTIYRYAIKINSNLFLNIVAVDNLDMTTFYSFQCSMCASPILKGLTFIDTPGILSGEKQRIERGYDFSGVVEWFSERVDRILLLFDAHKLGEFPIEIENKQAY